MRSNPGVSTDRGDTQGRSLALTIYGATSAENQWIIDGVNTTNVFKGVQGKAINNEFVQEVEVKTGGYQAEYGRALGGVINVITKSGGNEFHGDAFVYYDSTGTAAEKEFRPGDSGIAEMRVVDGEPVRLRRGPRRVPPQGSSLVLRRLQPRQLSGATCRALQSSTLRLDRGPVPARRHEQPLLGKADLEPRRLDDGRRHGLRRPLDELGRRRGRPPAGPGRRRSDAARESRPVDLVLRAVSGRDRLRRPAQPSSSGRARSRLFRARTTRTATPSRRPPGSATWTRPAPAARPDEPCDFPAGGQLRHRRLRLRHRAQRPQHVAPAAVRRPAVTLYEGDHEIKVGRRLSGRPDRGPGSSTRGSRSSGSETIRASSITPTASSRRARRIPTPVPDRARGSGPRLRRLRCRTPGGSRRA